MKNRGEGGLNGLVFRGRYSSSVFHHRAVPSGAYKRAVCSEGAEKCRLKETEPGAESGVNKNQACPMSSVAILAEVESLVHERRN